MIIVNEGKKQTRYNPYENYIYECWKCACKVKIETSDLDKLIYKTADRWYERNIPSNKIKEVFIRCPNCNNLIDVEIAKQVHPFLTVIQNIGTKEEERK